MAKENESLFEEKYKKKYAKIAKKQELKRDKTDKYIRGVTDEVANNSNNMQKKLSDKEKQAMFAEYEKIIATLKELELRNKKGEKFNYKFKNLQYFKSLNGHSIYSNALSEQEQKDKASISAMMAYSQIDGGLAVSLEMVMGYIRPERKNEFLSACKNNQNLSHDLIGMSKVVKYFNQRDFTRAYASAIYFGLEDKLDLMEVFFKVKFNNNFRNQIADFKATIASISAYDAQAIRDEAGTNVFSQHDAMTTALKMSATGKSALDVISSSAMESIGKSNIQLGGNRRFNVNEQLPQDPIQTMFEMVSVHSKNFRELKETFGGNVKTARENEIKNIKEQEKRTDDIARNAKTQAENDMRKRVTTTANGRILMGGSEVSKEAFETAVSKAGARAEANARSAEVKQEQKDHEELMHSTTQRLEKINLQLETETNPKECERLHKEQQEINDAKKSIIMGATQRFVDESDARTLNAYQQILTELEEKLKKSNSPKEKSNLSKQIGEYESKVQSILDKINAEKLKISSDIIQKSEEIEQLETLIQAKNREIIGARDPEQRNKAHRELYELKSKCKDLNNELNKLTDEAIASGNDFNSFMAVSGNDKKRLEDHIKRKQALIDKCSETEESRKENKEIIKLYESQIKTMRQRIDDLLEYEQGAKMIGLCKKYDNLLKIVSAGGEIKEEEFKSMVKSIKTAEDFNKITGEKVTQKELEQIKNGNLVKNFRIVDKDALDSVLIGEMEHLFDTMLDCQDEESEIQLTSILDARTQQIDKEIEPLKKEIAQLKQGLESGENANYAEEYLSAIQAREAKIQMFTGLKHKFEQQFAKKFGILKAEPEADSAKKQEIAEQEQVKTNPESNKTEPEAESQNVKEAKVDENEAKNSKAKSNEADGDSLGRKLADNVTQKFNETESAIEENNKASNGNVSASQPQMNQLGSDALCGEYGSILQNANGMTQNQKNMSSKMIV